MIKLDGESKVALIFGQMNGMLDIAPKLIRANNIGRTTRSQSKSSTYWGE